MQFSENNLRNIIKEEFLLKIADGLKIEIAIADPKDNEIIFNTAHFRLDGSQKSVLYINAQLQAILYIDKNTINKFKEISGSSLEIFQDHIYSIKKTISFFLEGCFFNFTKISDLEHQLEMLAEQTEFISDLFTFESGSLEPAEIARIMVEKTKKVIKVDKALICISENGSNFIFPAHLDFDSRQIVYLLTSMTGNQLLRELYNLPHEVLLNQDTDLTQFLALLPNF